jgi:glycosyltransferase involved in cell wall biosynthesis
MRFTLVTTCLNEMGSFPRWQEDLNAQTRQPDEIVIVDAESTDGTRERLLDWAKNDPRVKVRIERCSVARGRNLAVEMAAHDYIVSTDMGVRLSPVWFEEITKPFEADSTVQVVAGSYEIDVTTVRRAVARAEYYVEDGGKAHLGEGFIPGNRSLAFTRFVHRELGGLPEDLTMAADDSVFGRQILQAGYKMAYAPGALTYWPRPTKLRDFCREKFRYGYGDGEAAIKMPFAYKLYLEGRLPRVFVPIITGLRHVQTHLKWRAVRAALGKLDIPALACMPLLLFCRAHAFARGYVKGYQSGEHHCAQCRARIARVQ